MAEKWKDLDIDGRRLNRIIRLLETLIKKEEDIDKVVRLTNSLCYLTGKKLELAYKMLKIDEIFRKVKAKQKREEMYGV